MRNKDETLLRTIGLQQRLLAEVVRVHEANQVLEEPQADAKALAAGGDLEHRIVVRAGALSITPSLTEALQQLRSVSFWVVILGLLAAALVGAATARAALGPGGGVLPVNFFWVLGSILGVQLIALILWLLLILKRSGLMSTGSLGGAALALSRRLTRWLHKGPSHGVVVQAVAGVFARSPLGRWKLSALSHALWSAFLLGCLLMVIILLWARQYSFAWETTLLSEDTYVPLTRTLAVIPEALGFDAPDAQQIRASRWTERGQPLPASREAWSGLLLGSIVVYGLLPRLLCLGLCSALGWRAARRFRLDTGLPEYARLRPRLMPGSRAIGVVDPDQRPPGMDTSSLTPLLEFSGPVALLGFEIQPPASPWPPALTGVQWLDLGIVDSRDQRRQALERIQAEGPGLIVLVCSLVTTPDRGVQSFIYRLQSTTGIPVAVILSEGQRLRARGHPEEMEQRIRDWQQLTSAAQVPEALVLSVDLDHLTDASRRHLARLVGAKGLSAPLRHIEQAFALILRHVKGWSGRPGPDQQAELHREIARLYQNQGWQSLLRTQTRLTDVPLERLKSSADRMVDLLPQRLRRHPRWLAAGAMAGAMGCIAAATLAAPGAIAALPLWAGMGAALAVIVPTREKAPEAATNEFGEGVTSAALFAVLLESQGRDEASITRIIDQVAGDDEDPVMATPEAAGHWLDEARRRFDLALMTETTL